MGNLRKYVEPELLPWSLRAALSRLWAWLNEPSSGSLTTAPGFGEYYDGLGPFLGQKGKDAWMARINREPVIPDPPQVAIETIKNGGPARVTVR